MQVFVFLGVNGHVSLLLCCVRVSECVCCFCTLCVSVFGVQLCSGQLASLLCAVWGMHRLCVVSHTLLLLLRVITSPLRMETLPSTMLQ